MPKSLLIFTDGGARGNPGPAAIGVVVTDAAGAVADPDQVLYQHGETLGIATNNEAEYQAFLHSVIWLKQYAQSNSVEKVVWKLDSMLVVQQLQRNWKIKEPRLQLLAEQIWQQIKTLSCEYVITHVPRAQNAAADRLVNAALDGKL